MTNYSSYREGIKTIVSDVARLSDVVNAEVLFQTKSRSKNEIIRVEARKGIVGSLDNINKKINEISYKTKTHKKIQSCQYIIQSWNYIKAFLN